jgi:hypothetical protein
MVGVVITGDRATGRTAAGIDRAHELTGGQAAARFICPHPVISVAGQARRTAAMKC